MTYAQIKSVYKHLKSSELEQEIRDREHRRYDTRKVGADGCMTDAYVIKACKELLMERKEAGQDDAC